MRSYIEKNGLTILTIILVVTILVVVPQMLPNTGKVYDYIEAEMGVPIIGAHIDSPAVIIVVEEREFYSSIIDLNASVVYKGHYGFNRHYYVFNEPMTIAYTWSVSYIDIAVIWGSIK